jgi:hypothetical protein
MRELDYLDSKGPIAHFETQWSATRKARDSETAGPADPEPEVVAIIGSNEVKPGTSSTIIQAGPWGNTLVSTVTKGQDGTITVTTATSLEPGLSGGGSRVYGSDGSLTSNSSFTVTGADGQTKVHSESGSVEGGVVTDAKSDAGTTADGGFYSVSSVSENGQTTERSSFSADGQGNSSETTVDYDASGGYSITTSSTDSAGNTSTDTTTYDKDGNETGHEQTESGGSGGDNGSGGEPGGGDGGGGDSGGGEMPSDDGTDESPQLRHSGVSNVRFGEMLDDALGNFPKPDGGDPAATLGSMLDEDFGSSMPSAGDEGSGSEAPPSIDVRRFVPPAEPDPELNPRALIAAGAAVLGAKALVGLNRLAAREIKG